MDSSKRKSALVVEGGAMRGIFAAGVLDAFLEEEQPKFSFAIGVSAGSTNLIGYLAGDHGRSRRILLEHATQPDFLNWRRYLKGGHFCDVSWLWNQSFKDIHLSVDHYFKQGVPLYVVTTSVTTGEAVYTEVTEANLHTTFPASCAIPLAYRDYPLLNEEAMTDGGLADSIPVIKAYAMGARDITVVLSQPWGHRKVIRETPKFMRRLFPDHPALFEAVARRGLQYNEALDFIAKPPADCRITAIAPPVGFPVGRFTQNPAKLEAGYQAGREAGLQVATSANKEGIFGC